jgi:hypothetical protein
LASKKAGAPKLSKQEETLLQAQLAKEKVVRSEVESLKRRLSEGLQIVHSLVETQLEVFQHYISRLIALLLPCALGRPAELLGTAPFDAIIVSLQYRFLILIYVLILSKESRDLLRREVHIHKSLGRHCYPPCHQLDFCSGRPSDRAAGAYVNLIKSFICIWNAKHACRAYTKSSLSMLHSCGAEPIESCYILIHPPPANSNNS